MPPARARGAAVVVLLAALDAARAQCDLAQHVRAGETYYAYNPNFPEHYAPNTQCSWRAFADAGSRIRLSCGFFELPESVGCQGDRVRVSPSGDNALSDAHIYCGRGYFALLSDAVSLTMVLESTYSSAGGRFLCNITAVAGASFSCYCGMKKQARIAGGQETGVNEYPFMAALVDSEQRLIYCGASVISAHFALTAAACALRDAGRAALLVGAHDVLAGDDTEANIYQVHAFITHPRFNQGDPNVEQDNDVALVRVQGAISMSREVMPVCLPIRYTQYDFAYSKVEVLGWGSPEFGGATSTKLKKAELYVQAPEQCSAVYGNAVSYRQMCAYNAGKDACQMDHGGPLYWQDPHTGRVYIVGVVSQPACASSSPGVNTRVTSYLDWIASVIGAEDQYCIV